MSSKFRDRLSRCEAFIQVELERVQARLAEYFPRINSRFKDFTLHDEVHISALESILDWLVTEPTWSALNDYDMFCLACSLWSHDIGLGATEIEINDFCEYNGIARPEAHLHALFVRDNHASLSRQIIRNILSECHDARLTSLSDTVGQIAESHGYYKLDQIETQVPITITGHAAKPLFLAIVIRLADLLHCTHDRAPWILYKARRVEDLVSVQHWKRHRATVGVNYDLPTNSFRVHVQTDDIKTFEWAVEYFKLITKELDYCAAICSKFNIQVGDGRIVTFKVHPTYNTPFLSEVVKIDIEPLAAINTFTGTYLYDDKSIVIRELMQNAIDACLVRRKSEAYVQPSIAIGYSSSERLLTVTDNGIGMTLEEIKDSLLKSCSSGFRNTKQSDDLIAKFGIGFLSVFIVAESITLRTRSLKSSANKAYIVKITNTHDPIEIRELELCNIGSKIDILLKQGITFAKRDFIKWSPSEDLRGWISFQIDGEDIKAQQGRDIGYSVGPKFEVKDIDYADDTFSLHLKGIIYRDKEQGCVWPCGLSFQSLNGFPKEVYRLPDLKKRYYIGGVPLVSQDGQVPRYEKSGVTGPLFERYFAPIDFNLKKPGLIELNLPRNAFIHSESNESLFEKIDEQFVDLIMAFYNHLLIQEPNRGSSSAALISEYWLTRTEGACSFPKHYPSPHSRKAIDKLKPLWADVLCDYLSENYSAERKSFISALESDYPTIFINQLLISVLKFRNYNLHKLIDNLRKHFGGVNIIQAISSPFRKLEEDAFLSVMAQSVALYDLYESSIWHPPIKVFHFKKEDYFPRPSINAISVIGSECPICGYVSNGLGTGSRAGNNSFQVIVNLNSSKGDLKYIEEQLAKHSDQITSFRPTSREDIFSKLTSVGLEGAYQTSDFIHPCFRNPIPHTDDLKGVGIYFDIETGEAIQFQMGKVRV